MACFNGFTVNVRDQKMRDNPTSLNSVSEIQISKNLASNSQKHWSSKYGLATDSNFKNNALK